MNTIVQHDFSQIPPAEIPRSQFDRSHDYITTLQAGDVVPVYLDLAYPGDVFNLNMKAFGRLATPIKPIMDNMWIDFHFFAVPMRLLWDNWNRFMGEQDNPADSTDFLVPQVVAPAGGFLTGSMADYFGFPVGVAGVSVSAMPFRAVNLIRRDWYRDQNLEDSPVINRDDGPDDIADFPIFKRSKAHDYFTSCLPWPSKTNDVTLPLGDTAPVEGTGIPTWLVDGAPLHIAGNTVNSGVYWGNTGQAVSASGKPWADPQLEVDLTAATVTTINALREAFQLQRLLERDARSGTRLPELIRAHFGVISDDARHQRPEFLGSSRAYVNIHPVSQTSGTAGTGGYTDTPQANLAAFGTIAGSGGFTKAFKEHCVVVGLASTRTSQHYQQGVWAEWSYRTKFDFYWPVLSHLGEKAVLNKEIYAQGTADDSLTFGYQERWAEARYSQSKVTGKIRSTETGGTPLDLWHFGIEHGTLPTLSAEFIREAPPMDRVLAVPTEPHIILNCFFKIKAARPMPTYSVPGMIDHF